MRRFARTTCIPSVIAFAALVLATGQLWAGDSPWYAAARFGESRVDAELGSRQPRRFDDSDAATAVEVGYTLNRHLAVELGYQHLGSHAGFGSPCPQSVDSCVERLAALELCAEGFDCARAVNTLSADVDGVSLALVPSWPLTRGLSLRAKAGLIAWDTDVVVERGFLVPASTSRTTARGELFSDRDLIAGLGLRYDFPSGLGLLLQHETFQLDAETTSLGLSWRF